MKERYEDTETDVLRTETDPTGRGEHTGPVRVTVVVSLVLSGDSELWESLLTS